MLTKNSTVLLNIALVAIAIALWGHLLTPFILTPPAAAQGNNRVEVTAADVRGLPVSLRLQDPGIPVYSGRDLPLRVRLEPGAPIRLDLAGGNLPVRLEPGAPIRLDPIFNKVKVEVDSIGGLRIIDPTPSSTPVAITNDATMLYVVTHGGTLHRIRKDTLAVTKSVLLPDVIDPRSPK